MAGAFVNKFTSYYSCNDSHATRYTYITGFAKTYASKSKMFFSSSYSNVLLYTKTEVLNSPMMKMMAKANQKHNVHFWEPLLASLLCAFMNSRHFSSCWEMD